MTGNGHEAEDAARRTAWLVRRAGLDRTANAFPDDVAAAVAAADALRSALGRVEDPGTAPWPPAPVSTAR